MYLPFVLPFLPLRVHRAAPWYQAERREAPRESGCRYAFSLLAVAVLFLPLMHPPKATVRREAMGRVAVVPSQQPQRSGKNGLVKAQATAPKQPLPDSDLVCFFAIDNTLQPPRSVGVVDGSPLTFRCFYLVVLAALTTTTAARL